MYLAVLIYCNFGNIAESIAKDRNLEPHVLTKVEIVQLFSYYANIKKLNVGFVQKKKLKSYDLTIETIGNLAIINPDLPSWRILWEITDPSKLKLTIDKQNIIIEKYDLKGKKQITAKNQRKDKLFKSISQLLIWLKMDIDAITDSYVITKNQGKFLFVPKSKKEIDVTNYFKNISIILSEKGNVEKLVLTEKSDDQISITFDTPKVTYND